MGWAAASFAGSSTDVSGQIRARRPTNHIQGRSRWCLTLRPSLPGARLLAVIVRRVAVDGVDVEDAAGRRRHLVRELYMQRRARYAIVDALPVRGRPTPGEVGLVQVVFYLGHPRFGGPLIGDAGPLADHVEQQGLLVSGHLRGREALRFEHPAVLARAQ